MGLSIGKRPMPSTTCRSLWQTPVAAVRTSTSRPDGLSISTDSMVSGAFGLRKTAACISMGSPPWRALYPAGAKFARRRGPGARRRFTGAAVRCLPQWSSMAGRHLSYGWVVVGASTAVNALAWGVRSTFALFYVAMLAELGWSRGAAAFGYSLSWLCFALFAPVAGRLFDRLGARLIVCLGGVTLGVAVALTGRVTSLAQYYVCFGVLGAAGIAGMIIPSTTIVTRWLTRTRGTAMGVLSAGTAGGAVIFYPITAGLIAIVGWRSALLLFGGLLAGATLLLALLYRDPPPEAGPVAPAARIGGGGPTLGGALRSPRLWAAFVMTALGVIGYQIMATHQVAHAVDRGFAQPTVVWLFALGAACMMGGNLLGGWLSDHLGRGRVFVLGTVVAIAGIACFAVMSGP